MVVPFHYHWFIDLIWFIFRTAHHLASVCTSMTRNLLNWSSYLFLLTQCMIFAAFPFFLWRNKISRAYKIRATYSLCNSSLYIFPARGKHRLCSLGLFQPATGQIPWESRDTERASSSNSLSSSSGISQSCAAIFNCPQQIYRLGYANCWTLRYWQAQKKR